MKRIFVWLKAARLQLHILGALPVLVGALIASRETGDFSVVKFLLSEAVLLSALIAVAFANDYADAESDRLNKNINIFSGGSRAIVDGLISPQEMLSAAKIASLAAIGLSIISAAFFSIPSSVVAMTLIGLFVGIEYSLPPLKINWRGFGEAAVAVMYSIFCLYFGYMSQGRAAFNAGLIYFSIPLAIVVFLAILVTEIPDCDSDALSGKRTIPALFGKGAAFSVYIMGVISLYLSALILHLLGAISGGTLSGIMLSSPLGIAAIVISLGGEKAELKNVIMLCGLTMTLCVWTNAALAINLAFGR